MMRESRVTSMLPPQTRTAVLCAFERGAVLEQRGESGGAGAFGEGLLALEQHEDGGGDLVFFDGDDLVDVGFDERAG